MRAVITAVCLIFVSLVACADEGKPAAEYREGQHYRVLATPVPVSDPSKIEVAEVFWYGCGHCFNFEPLVRRWRQGLADDVAYVYVPAMWNGAMERHARIFYAAKALGVWEKVHQPIFNAINIDRKHLTDDGEIAAFFNEQGVDGDEMVKTLNSFGTTSQVKQADARARGYDIKGTPTLVVNGTYVIETEGAGSHEDMLKVANYLIDKIRAEKQK